MGTSLIITELLLIIVCKKKGCIFFIFRKTLSPYSAGTVIFWMERLKRVGIIVKREGHCGKEFKWSSGK
jgi:hypothetical protein